MDCKDYSDYINRIQRESVGLWQKELIKNVFDTGPFISAMYRSCPAPAPVPLTRIQRVREGFEEVGRRIKDAWRVLRYGECLEDWDD